MPTQDDIQLINFAGIPLAQWVKESSSKIVTFWASEDQQWVFFQRSCPLYGSRDTCDINDQTRANISYSEAGRILANL